MATMYSTPGVYVEEIAKFPPSVAQVETAIPAFIGYTHKATKKVEGDLNEIPTRITSLLEYETYFGVADVETEIAVNVIDDVISVTLADADKSKFKMYYSMQIYFANGGGPCYIVSVGDYDATIALGSETTSGLSKGLKILEKVDEPTLIVFPDSTAISSGDFHGLYNSALTQCNKLQDRFTLIDTLSPDAITGLRDGITLGKDFLKYGAAYYPHLETILDYSYNEADVEVTVTVDEVEGTPITLDTLEEDDNALYNRIKVEIGLVPIVLPPSSAMAGVYARVDSTRGVWKAPANVGLNYVIKPSYQISHEEQKELNVHTTGKSINAIRTFSGKGTLVWGARTLAGNDNEWRYVPVRRFFNFAEESIKKASEQFVFEPNDANTWVKIKAMISNFLNLQWRAGALVGATPDKAFYVSVGLGETMTAQDILEGNLIIEIGMAAVRPAEFIVLKFSHKMQEL